MLEIKSLLFLDHSRKGKNFIRLNLQRHLLQIQEFGDNIANCGGNYCLLDYFGSSAELVVTVYQASYSHLLDDQGLRVAPELQSVEIDFNFVCSVEERPINVTAPQLTPVGQPEEQLPPGVFYPNFLPGEYITFVFVFSKYCICEHEGIKKLTQAATVALSSAGQCSAWLTSTGSHAWTCLQLALLSPPPTLLRSVQLSVEETVSFLSYQVPEEL